MARQAARLDDYGGMEEPECLFAHGFFRRTGEASSVNRRRRGPSARRGPATDPDYPPPSWASRRQGCEPCHGTVPASTLRRLASAPLSEADLCNDIAQVKHRAKNKVRTLHTRLSSPPRHHRPCAGEPDGLKRRASPDRDGRHKPSHDGRGCHSRPECSGGDETHRQRREREWNPSPPAQRPRRWEASSPHLVLPFTFGHGEALKSHGVGLDG